MPTAVTRREMRDIEQIRFVSAHYEMLQGLVVIPPALVVAFLIFAGSAAGERFDRGGWYAVVIAVGIAATLVAVSLNRRFREQYGDVRPKAGQTRGLFAGSVAVALPVVLLQVADLDLPISLEGLVGSGAALAAAWLLRPLAVPYLLVGVVGTLASLLPIASSTDPDRHALSELPYLLVAVCLAGVVIAGWSEVLLRRTLAAPER